MPPKICLKPLPSRIFSEFLHVDLLYIPYVPSTTGGPDQDNDGTGNLHKPCQVTHHLKIRVFGSRVFYSTSMMDRRGEGMQNKPALGTEIDNHALVPLCLQGRAQRLRLLRPGMVASYTVCNSPPSLIYRGRD